MFKNVLRQSLHYLFVAFAALAVIISSANSEALHEVFHALANTSCEIESQLALGEEGLQALEHLEIKHSCFFQYFLSLNVQDLLMVDHTQLGAEISETHRTKQLLKKSAFVFRFVIVSHLSRGPPRFLFS